MLKIRNLFYCFCILFTAQVTAQPLSKLSNKPDSVARTFNTFTSTVPGIYNYADTSFVPVLREGAMLAVQNTLYKRRLDSVQHEVPLDYNQYVQTYIDIYTNSRRRNEMGRVLGLTKYYFPIYEKALRETGIPEEIKYLSVVESALNPFAVSRVGATGPWQFMFTTAKLYGLNMDKYVDERRDPIQASYAAAAYLRDAYQDFGDWLVAIASYNCGKGNIVRAMQKAHASDFWSIRPYLPLETRNYVPAYIAIAYVMNYYSKHNILPSPCSFATLTDTMMVTHGVNLANLAKTIGSSLTELCMLNPQYKKRMVNGAPEAPRRLVIPQVDKETYARLYDVLNNNGAPSADFSVLTAVANTNNAGSKHKTHKVKKGETLGSIADNYGVEVQDLKVWNHLRKLKVKPGQVIKITAPDEEVAAFSKEPAATKHRKGKSFLTYTVKNGDTLSAIAEKFDGATVTKIKELNRLKKDRLKPGMTLKISKG